MADKGVVQVEVLEVLQNYYAGCAQWSFSVAGDLIKEVNGPTQQSSPYGNPG